MCEYERNPSRNEEAMANVKVVFTFLLVFDLEKGEPEGQCQVWVVLCEGLLIRSIVCEYERNPSRNEEAMANVVKFFYIFTSI